MRAPVGVVLVAGLLAACTGTSTAEDQASAGGAAAARPFCDEVTSAFRSLADAFGGAGTEDLGALPPLLDRTVATFDEVTAPEEIDGDWRTVREGVADLRERVSALDPADPAAAEQVDSALLGLRDDAGDSFEAITAYAQQYCPELAAPST